METARRFSRGSRRRRSGHPLFGQLLTAAVESAADEVAIRYNPTGDPADQREMTYREIDEASSQVARELIERGIGPGDVVAIGIARSPESVLAVWAVAKTGAAHVPIDPGAPADRIEHIATDSGAAFGLTTSRFRGALGRTLYWIELDDPVQAARIAQRPRHPISYTDRVRTLDERHPAYIVYTPDAAGSPGVAIPHSGPATVVAAIAEIYGITSDSRVAHLCAPNLDISILELLLTFTSGATLVIAPAGAPDGRDVAGLVARERVTHMITTAAVLARVDPAGLGDRVLVAAVVQEFGRGLPGRWAREHNIVLSYGHTEAATIATSTGVMYADDPITIGAALNAAGALVLDTRLRPVPAGAVGELYLAGPALANGYVNRPAHTAERFVAAPFGADMGQPGARMYRTGDLVRRIETPYGAEFEYLGRAGTRVPPDGFAASNGAAEVAVLPGETLAAERSPAPLLPGSSRMGGLGRAAHAEPVSRPAGSPVRAGDPVPVADRADAGNPEVAVRGYPAVELPGGADGEVPLFLDLHSVAGAYPASAQHLVLSLPEGIDRAGLAATLGAVTARHDMLRARLLDEGGRYRLEVAESAPAAGVLISEVEVPAGSGGAGLAEVAAAALNPTVTQLDPLSGRMVAATWLRRPDARDALLLAVHQSVADQESWRIVVADLRVAWAQIAAGLRIELPAVGTSFRRWAHALADEATQPERETELAYWRKVLATPDPLLGSRAPAPGADTYATVRRFAAEVPPGVAGRLLTEVPIRYRAGVDEALVAALALALRNWRARRGVECTVARIQLEGSGRAAAVVPGADFTRTVGRFTTEYPVALDLSDIDADAALRGGADTGALVRSVQEQLGAVPDQGIGFGLLRLPVTGAIAEELDGVPAQIGFRCRGPIPAGEVTARPGDTAWSPVGDPGAEAEFDRRMPVQLVIDIDAVARADGGLAVSFDYAADLVPEIAVRELAEDWLTAVRALAGLSEDPQADGRALPGSAAVPDRLDAWPAGPRPEDMLRGARPTELAAVLAPPQPPGTGIGELDLTLGQAETAAMAAYAAAAGVTVGTVAQALWALLLASLTGRADVVFGAVVPGRPLDPAGETADPIPVRVSFDPGWTVQDLLVRIQTEQATLLEHHLPADIGPAAGLFDTVLVYEPHPVDATSDGMPGHVIAGPAARISAGYPVTLVVEPADRLRVRVCYHRETVAEASAQALSGLLRALVGQLLAVPARAQVPAPGWWRAPGSLTGHGELPADRPRPDAPSRHCGQVSRELHGDLCDALNIVAAQWNTTELTVVQAALAVLLARLSGKRETAVGAFATRDSAAGLSVLHTEVDPGRGFGALLDAACGTGAGIGPAGVGGERLGYLIDTVRTVAGHPPFRVMLSDELQPGDLPEKLDLRVDLVDTAAGATLTFTYARDLFDAPTIGDHADRLVRILAAVAADPGVTVGDIDLLARGERDLVLREWNSAGVAVPAVTLADLIEAQARLRPTAAAVRSGATTLSFEELLDRAYRVARGVIDAGAGPENLVAVAIPRSEELPVALLGVLLSGAGYLPIDTTYPRQRLEYILSDARPVAVLTTGPERAAVPSGDLPVVLIEDTAHYAATAVTDTDRRAPLRPGNPAYATYTSGSTGAPKAVTVTHRNVVELFANTQLMFEFDDTDVWTLFHSSAFDFSVWELWCALASGGSVVVVDRPTAQSPEQFRELLIREKVTVLNQTPSAFYRLAEADRVAQTAGGSGALSLRYVVFGGEALDIRRLRHWYERHGTPGGTGSAAPWLVNMYGITETTVHVSFLALDEQLMDHPASVIGRALPGLDAFVLDDRLQPAPFGVPGEIYVAGAQLARGYLGRPGRTATRFVADPFGPPGSRMYRSGDIGRWAGFAGRAGLEYAGRADTQVQLRGFRIELGEVEAALLRDPGVGRAAAVLRGDEIAGDRLVGYVVPVADQDPAVDAERIRERAGEFLPEYMVPDLVVLLDALPSTPGGKLDRAALPDPASVRREHDATPAGRTRTAAPRVVVPVPRPTLERVHRPERIPLSPAQYRLWLLDRDEPGAAGRNIALAIGLTGALDTSALRYALSDVLERHEILRTCYPADPDGVPYQEILPVAQVLRGGMETDTTEDAPGRIGELLSAGFDLTGAAPIRGLLLATGADEHVLALVVHAIAADRTSLAPLTRDLMTAYLARINGESPRWSPLPVQYADYAIWQCAVAGGEDDENTVGAQQVEFWREQLDGASGGPELPLDRPRPDLPSRHADTTDFTVDAQVHDGLAALAGDRDATLFTVVHAAVTVLLHRLTGSGDIAIATPNAGRGEPDLANSVGLFAGMLLLRTEVHVAQTFTELLDAARETDLAAFAHADIPFEQVVEVVAPERDIVRDPLFGVVLSFRGDEQVTLQLPGLIVHGPAQCTPVAEYDLWIDIDPGRETGGPPGELRAALTYATELFDEETVRSFGRRLARILTAVAADPRVRIGDIDIDDSENNSAAVLAVDSAVLAVDSQVLAVDSQVLAVDPAVFTVDPAVFTVDPAAFTVDTAVPAVTAGTALAQTLGASVEDDPSGPAVVWGENAMTYQELDARSSQLARELIARGCGPGSGVVTALGRGVDGVVATWAVLKAGAALVPADAVAAAAAAGLVVEVGLTVTAEPELPNVHWLTLGDPAVAAAVARRSPRPVTHAHRVRPLRGGDVVVVDAAGYRTGYDQLAAAVTRVHNATDLTYEARSYRYGRGDGPAAVLEVVAAGAAGASIVLIPDTIQRVTPADEWVTHLWSDTEGLAVLDPDTLVDLTAVIVDEAAAPGAAWTGAARVLELSTLLG
ncbi:amino acid adenylation domain-containing protein [Nocardia sp. NPDC051750]|uniref:amino acid adenylation domain-containing protein n=1 Tax=Nocardia sp. NPDC051750 TaxID=3364325 RepID=UPI0037B23510